MCIVVEVTKSRHYAIHIPCRGTPAKLGNVCTGARRYPASSKPEHKKQTPLNHARISARTSLHHSAWQQQQQQRNLVRPLPEFARVRAVWVQMTRRPSCGGARTKYSSSRGLPTRPSGLPFVVAQERRAASQWQGHETKLFAAALANLPYLHLQTPRVGALSSSSSSPSG